MYLTDTGPREMQAGRRNKMTEYFQPRGKHCGRKMQMLKKYRKKKRPDLSLNSIVKRKRKLEKAYHTEKSKAQPHGKELEKREKSLHWLVLTPAPPERRPFHVLALCQAD